MIINIKLKYLICFIITLNVYSLAPKSPVSVKQNNSISLLKRKKLTRNIIKSSVAVSSLLFSADKTSISNDDIYYSVAHDDKVKLSDILDYWLALTDQEFFNRISEFIEEPYAMKILELYSQKSYYMAPSSAQPYYFALNNISTYIDYENGKYFLKFLIQNNFWGVKDSFIELRTVVDEHLFAECCDLLVAQRPRDIMTSWLNDNVLLDLIPTLEKSNNLYSKLLLDIRKDKITDIKKLRLASLTPLIINGEFSYQAAISAVDDDELYLDALAKFAEYPEDVIKSSFYSSTKDASGSILSSFKDMYDKDITQLENKLDKYSPVKLYTLIYSANDKSEFFNFLLNILTTKIYSSPESFKKCFIVGNNISFYLYLKTLSDSELKDILKKINSEDFLYIINNLIKGNDFRYNRHLLIEKYKMLKTYISISNSERYVDLLNDVKEDILQRIRINPSDCFLLSDKLIYDDFFKECLIFSFEVMQKGEDHAEYYTSPYIRLLSEFVNKDSSEDLKKLGIGFLSTCIEKDPHMMFEALRTTIYLETINKLYPTPMLDFLKEIKNADYTYEEKNDVILLADDVINKKLSLDSAFTIAKNPIQLIRNAENILKQKECYGKISIQKSLPDLYAKVAININQLHNETDAIRFKIIEEATSEELYKLIVYGESELGRTYVAGEESLYTSSLNGIFKRLLEVLTKENITGIQLLEKLDYFHFRQFFRVLVGYGRIEDFFATITEKEQLKLLTTFSAKLEKEQNFLQEASVVADVFYELKDNQEILDKLLRIIKDEYLRVYSTGEEQAIAVYATLSDMFALGSSKEKSAQNSFINEKIHNDSLFDSNGVNCQRYYFYNDEDGRASFDNFVSQYKDDDNWSVDFNDKAYVKISSLNNKKIVILANHPDNVQKGNAFIDTLIVNKDLTIKVLVHRGHSYHADKTIIKITPSARFISLGSCGGYNNIAKVLEKNKYAQIISTKGTGSKWINDPILKLINDNIRIGNDLDWQKVQNRAHQIFNKDKKLKSLFSDYVFPHENFVALFIASYNNKLQEVQANQLKLKFKKEEDTHNYFIEIFKGLKNIFTASA